MSAQVFFDKERVKMHIASIKKGGQNFEIDVDFDAAIKFKEGKADVKDALKAEKIFSDARKGMLASETQMKQLFGTSEPLEVAEIILKKGELPLTAEYKNKLKEEKRKQIIEFIRKNAVDPRTNIPHPANRIENAIEEAKVKIDEFKSVQQQVDDILKKLRPIIPISFMKKEIAVKIPADYAAKSYSTVNSFGKMLKEEWQTDGSWVVVVEMPGGLETDFYDALNKICHGNIESKVLKVK